VIPQHTHETTARPSYPTTTPTEISEAIRILDESHKQQILDLRLRMDALQREYLRERQELSTKLLQAIRSHEVCTDPVTLSLPGLYPSSMMPNVTPVVATAPVLEPESAGDHIAPPPPMPAMTTTAVPLTTSLPPIQYAAVLPGSRYQIQVNPDGSQHVIHVQPAPAAMTTSPPPSTLTASAPSTSSSTTTTTSTSTS